MCMKRIFTFLILILFVSAGYAEQPQGIIMKATSVPVIDGEIDDAWEDAIIYDIDKPIRTEVPTLGEPGETNWRALWNDDGIFILLVVKDNNWYPSYKVAGSNNWEYDKPEIYFDVNYILADGLGAQHNQGHYQVAPAAELAKIDGTATTQTNGVKYAFKVSDPAYVAEYFVPWSLLKDKDGIEFDKTGTMGFDVTIIDRDEGDAGRRRAVWANTAAIDESWSNMNDAGLIVFDGSEPPVYIDKITLTGGTITEDNGTLQIVATIEPEEATNKALKWTVTNKTGRATISSTGLLTGILDGIVTVTADATDGSYEYATIDVEISGQIPTLWELNVVRNGLFDQVGEGNAPSEWGGWIDGGYGGPHSVVDGVAVLAVAQAHATEAWHYQFNQERLTALPNIPYKVSVVTWAENNRAITLDFEDTSGNNYNRYGKSNHTLAAGGRSEWSFDITTEPTRYEFDVEFDQIVASTVQKIQFMISQALGTVYVDSVLLISEADLALIPTNVPVNTLETFKVYPNPANDKLNVELGSPNRRVAIFNSLGVKIEETISFGTKLEFDVRSYPRGIYFVRSDDQVMKFIKQ